MSVIEELLTSESRSFEVTRNSRPIDESEPILEDSAYGEALVTQHITLDFTPNEEVDNDFVQRKCVAFWDYINSRPELNNMCTAPDRCDSSNVSEVSSKSSDFKPVEPNVPETQENTAVSILEFVDEKHLIDRAFEARLPNLSCEFDRKSYTNTSGTSKDSPILESTSSKSLKQKKQSKRADKKTPTKLHKFCKKMQKWDVDHPKSMAPPGPVPVLQADVKLI